MSAGDLARLKQLEAEKSQMQRIIARQTVKIDAIEQLMRKLPALVIDNWGERSPESRWRGTSPKWGVRAHQSGTRLSASTLISSSRGRASMARGAPFKMTAAKLRLAMSAMGQLETHVGDLCRELGATRQTLYRHVGPDGSLRPDGRKILN